MRGMRLWWSNDPGEPSCAGSPAILRKVLRTGGFAPPPYDGFAFVSNRPVGRGPPMPGGPTPFVTCAVPPFPGSSQACTAWGEYRHLRWDGQGECVANWRQRSLITSGDQDSRLVPGAQSHPPTVVGQRPTLVEVPALEGRRNRSTGAVVQTQQRFRLVRVVLALQWSGAQ